LTTHADTDWLLEELGATMELSGQQIRPAALALLASDLSHIDKPLLRMALARIRAEHKGRSSPAPCCSTWTMPWAGCCRRKPTLALSSSDDSATIVWTNEIADAWTVAAPLLRAGDKFGARQAFVEAYGRITGEARALRQHPVVQVSLGHDPRAHPRLQEAMTAGRCRVVWRP
jgi:hypothetical protein